MTSVDTKPRVIATVDATYSRGELAEIAALGFLDRDRIVGREPIVPQVARRAITALDVLNEAPDYASSFSRGLAVDAAAGQRTLWLSGTASIDESGRTVYPGDLRAQQWRTYRNLTRLLESQGADWSDIVRTSCYLRDIERDYDAFNAVRTLFFRCLALDPLPASTGIQARLCRSDLLVEIEAFAIVRVDGARPGRRP
jgi:enamine deaminase RidA (YjgF/YER057c/UK114 family)